MEGRGVTEQGAQKNAGGLTRKKSSKVTLGHPTTATVSKRPRAVKQPVDVLTLRETQKCDECNVAATNRLRDMHDLRLIEEALKKEILAEDRRSEELLKKLREECLEQSEQFEEICKTEEEIHATIQNEMDEKDTLQSEIVDIESDLKKRMEYSHTLFNLLFPVWDNDRNENEDKPLWELLSPEGVVRRISTLTDKYQSLVQKCAILEKELGHDCDAQFQEMKGKEEKLDLQLNAMREQIESANAKLIMLTKTVKIFQSSIAIQEQDAMLDALDKKVTEMYYSISPENSCNTSLDTLQKLAVFERHLGLCFKQLDSLPKEADGYKALRREVRRMVKKHQYEEQLKLEIERQEDMKTKRMKRSLSEPLKNVGRKLMPRSFLPSKVKSKAEVTEMESSRGDDPYRISLTQD